MNSRIRIKPVKWLYYNNQPEDSEAFAIITSSYEVRESKLSRLRSRLILTFNDVTDPSRSDSFNSSLAKKIHEYTDSIPADTPLIYVCCDSGESRSSAIACSILRYFGMDDMPIWRDAHYHPNPLVYKLMCEEFGITVTDGELQKKVNINEKALSDTIAAARGS